MSRVTAIKPQRNNKRVNIYLDGEFSFGLDLENFVTLGLRLDQELTNKQIKEIKDKSDKAKILNKVLSFATLRPRSEKEIQDWFKRKRIDVLIHQYILDKLKKFELIDDSKFAKWWVEQRLAFKKPSKRILNYELRIKGIKQETIDNVLGEVKIDEVKIAKELFEKKKYKWDKFDKKTKKQKATQYLAGKGFGWNIIAKVIQ